LPDVQVLHEKYADDPNVVILAMNVRDDNERMAAYWAERGYTFPTLNDADDLAEQFGVKAFPSTVIIGPDGRVIHAAVGSISAYEDELKKALESID
jgi:peroxiredoxin